MSTKKRITRAVLMGGASLVVALSTAYAEEAVKFEIKSGSLVKALNEYARQSNQEILFSSEIVAGKEAKAVNGVYAPGDALALLLAGTGLEYTVDGGDTVLINDPDKVGVYGATQAADEPDNVGVSPARQAGDEDDDVETIDSESDPDDPDAEDREVITVTGTRIRGGLPTERVDVIDAAEIALRGVTDIEGLLRTIPNNTNTFDASSNITGIDGAASDIRRTGITNNNGAASFNLRGVGEDATLVLINGRRPVSSSANRGSVTDVAGIPIEAIERVEILQGGASAIYGADAVGGVVNIILKKDYTGARISGRYGYSSTGGDDYHVAGQFGRNWDSGNLFIGLRYEGTEPIQSAKFGYENNDFRDIGGSNFERGNEFGIYTSFTGEVLGRPPGFTPPLVASELLTEDEVEYGSSLNRDRSPETETVNVFGTITQGLFDDSVEMVIDGRFSQRDTEIVGGPRTFFEFLFPGAPNNPFSGFGPSGVGNYVYIAKRELDAGVYPITRLLSESSSWDIGGTFSTEQFGWDLQAVVSYGKETSESFNLGLRPFLTPVVDFLRGDFLDPGSAMALAPFIVDDTQDPTTNTSSILFSEITATGDLYELPGGALQLAVGGEFRKETFRNQDAVFEGVSFLSFGGAERAVLSGFFEFAIPVFGDDFTAPGFHELTFSVAGRYEDYQDDIDTVFSDFTNFPPTIDTMRVQDKIDRSQFSPKYGVSWKPVEAVRITASYGKSFLAPPMALLGNSGNVSIRTILDPFHPSGSPAPAFGVVSTATNETIDNELSKNISTGISIRPTSLPSLLLTADYFNIRYTDRITTVFPSEILANPDVFGEFITRDSAGVLTELITPFGVNIAREKRTGIEFGAKYQHNAGSGVMYYEVDVIKALKTRVQLGVDSAVQNRDRTRFAPLDLRARGAIGWNNDVWSVNAAVNYSSGYELRFAFAPDGELTDLGFENGVISDVDSVTTVDLNVGYNVPDNHGVLSGTRLQVGATNLFKKAAPFANVATGVSALNYDLRGRVVFAEVSKSF